MELSIEQALQQGTAAHREERLEEAERVLADGQRAGVSAAKLQRWEGKMQSELSAISGMPQQEASHQLGGHQDELSPR